MSRGEKRAAAKGRAQSQCGGSPEGARSRPAAPRRVAAVGGRSRWLAQVPLLLLLVERTGSDGRKDLAAAKTNRYTPHARQNGMKARSNARERYSLPFSIVSSSFLLRSALASSVQSVAPENKRKVLKFHRSSTSSSRIPRRFGRPSVHSIPVHPSSVPSPLKLRPTAADLPISRWTSPLCRRCSTEPNQAVARRTSPA